MEDKAYYIWGDNGKKLCERCKDEEGNILLKTAATSIRLDSLMELACNPALARKTRNKRPNKQK